MAKFFVISEADRPDLRQLLDEFKAGNFATTDEFINAIAEAKANVDRETNIIGQFDQPVPGIDPNNKCGEGVMTVWDLVREGQTDAVFQATTRTEKVYNFRTTELPAAPVFVRAERHYKSGLFVAREPTSTTPTPGEQCSQCTTGSTAAAYSITISGIADNTCTECDLFNGTFQVNQTGGGPCNFEFLRDPAENACATPAQNNLLSLDINDNGGDVKVIVRWRIQEFGQADIEVARFEVDISGNPVDCMFDNLDVPFHSGAAVCDPTGGVCTVSAV